VFDSPELLHEQKLIYKTDSVVCLILMIIGRSGKLGAEMLGFARGQKRSCANGLARRFSPGGIN
jgi:hypothetical protein